ncbi:MAG TPA: glycosyltransferase [Polyangiaceae bacterium]|nr:glycosyltransferase [Polyangiaceae bacterium]
MVRIFLLIRSLDRGGAERQVVELASGLVDRGFHVTVCTFYDGGALRPHLEATPAVELVSLGKKGRWDVGLFLWRLQRAVRRAKPDIIHGYMGIANELSVVLGRLSGAKSVWGLRASNMNLSRYDAVSRYAFRAGALASRFADAIIVNSEAGRAHHAEHGYRSDRMVVVHNGIDCERFRPDPEARARLRAEWQITPDERLLGLVARLDPKKDHATFLKAAAELSKREPRARFVCVGAGAEAYKAELQVLARDLAIADILRWAGPRDDMLAVYNALDVLVLSSSFGEGFPNVVGEAMACGTPCVVTDVGDAALVVGETGAVVPPSDFVALADGMHSVLILPEVKAKTLGEAARDRIVSKFSKEALIGATAEVLRASLRSAR